VVGELVPSAPHAAAPNAKMAAISQLAFFLKANSSVRVDDVGVVGQELELANARQRRS
jgi:hypothetical protein